MLPAPCWYAEVAQRRTPHSDEPYQTGWNHRQSNGGQLGRPSGARFRTYERLKRYAEDVKDTLFESPELLKAIDEIYRYPLRQTATDTLNRQLRSGISDETLAPLVIALREDERLCIIHEEEETQEPRIICSLGLIEDCKNVRG